LICKIIFDERLWIAKIEAFLTQRRRDAEEGRERQRVYLTISFTVTTRI
jgi:hypothetical protein